MFYSDLQKYLDKTLRMATPEVEKNRPFTPLTKPEMEQGAQPYRGFTWDISSQENPLFSGGSAYKFGNAEIIINIMYDMDLCHSIAQTKALAQDDIDFVETLFLGHVTLASGNKFRMILENSEVQLFDEERYIVATGQFACHSTIFKIERLFGKYTSLKEDLYAYYKMDEETGTQLIDYSGNSRNIQYSDDTITNADIIDSDDYGNYLDLNNLRTREIYGEIPNFQSSDNLIFDVRKSFSWSFIYKIEYVDYHTGAVGYFFGNRNPDDNYRGIGCYLGYYSDYITGYLDYGEIGYAFQTLEFEEQLLLATQQWVVITQVFEYSYFTPNDSLNNIYMYGKTYINDKLALASSNSVNLTVRPDANSIYGGDPLYIGHYLPTAAIGHSKIKNLGFWNRALGQTEIKNLNTLYKSRGYIPQTMERI